jgi:type VI protein secretion system component VasA
LRFVIKCAFCKYVLASGFVQRDGKDYFPVCVEIEPCEICSPNKTAEDLQASKQQLKSSIALIHKAAVDSNMHKSDIDTLDLYLEHINYVLTS